MLTNIECFNIIDKINDKIKTSDHLNIYITLTTIPPRFLSDEFEVILNELVDQTINPAKIFISLPHQYKRSFNYDKNKFEDKIKQITDKYNLVEILRTNDYGPATKLLGLLESKTLNDNDLIIVLDDDVAYCNSIVSNYNIAFKLYDADICAFNQHNIAKWTPYMIKTKKEIYFNKYNDNLYGWLSFCVKYSKLNNIMTFYKEVCDKFPNILFHDDLIFTLYYKIYGLRAIGTNIPTFKYKKERSQNDNCEALRNANISNIKLRKQLEISTSKYYNSKFILNSAPTLTNTYINNITDNIIAVTVMSGNKSFTVNNKQYNIGHNTHISTFAIIKS